MPPFVLDGLADDALEEIGYALADPLAPKLSVAFSACSHGLRRALKAPIRQLRERRQKAEALCAFVSTDRDQMSCDVLRDATELNWEEKRLTAAHVDTLGMLLATNGLPQLETLNLAENMIDAERMHSLVRGLGWRALPSLKTLFLNDQDGNQSIGIGIGNAGAAALAAALSRGAMPSLDWLVLSCNQIDDEGLVALAVPLRTHPALTALNLSELDVGDEGVAALVAPGEGVLTKLKVLILHCTLITDVGCAKLVDALDSGVMPNLVCIELGAGGLVDSYEAIKPKFRASDEAQEAVQEALGRSIARRG